MFMGKDTVKRENEDLKELLEEHLQDPPLQVQNPKVALWVDHASHSGEFGSCRTK